MAANPKLIVLQSPPRTARARLIRRTQPDRSQSLRHLVQYLFLALNVVIGVQFYLFVRYFETGGRSVQVSRPPGVEGWLPIASLMNLKAFLVTGEVPSMMPAGMFLLVAFLAISIALRKAFCSWLCPVGTVSELLWRLGQKVFRLKVLPPRWLDVPLRGLKYLLLALFFYAVGSMSAAEIEQFMKSPFGLIADVKMLDFFRHLSQTAAVVLAVIGAFSLVIPNFWCRYLCPYGALMGLAALLSPARITRVQEACIECGKCSNICPAKLPVDRLVTIKSAECTACMECVAACPAEGALHLSYPGSGRITPISAAAIIVVLFAGIVLAARVAGHWHTSIPSQIHFDLINRSREIAHP